MKKQNFFLTIFLILFSVLVLLEVMFNQGNANADKLDPAKSGMQPGQSETRGLEDPVSQMSSESEVKSRVSQTISLGKLPLYFIANRGQVDEQARYYAKASRYTLWLTPEGLVFDSLRVEDKAKEPVPDHQPPLPGQLPPNTTHHSPFTTHPSPATTFQHDVSRLLFQGANPKPAMQAIDEQELKVNYFKGNDPAKWQGNVPTFKAVLYQDLYPHIDLKVYGIEREVEYDWIIRPGGDPGQIRFAYKNVKSTHIDADGNLVIETAFGEIRHQKPVSYQEEVAFNSHVGAQRAVPGDKSYRKEPGLEKRIPIDAKFQQTGPDTYGFSIEGYDNTRPLIIDPLILLYSTYLGGSKMEELNSITVDENGNVYLTGTTWSTDFPTRNAFQSNFSGNVDIFICKIDTNLSGESSLVYSTYLGGSGEDYINGMSIDDSGNVYITGWTGSTDFPTRNAFQNNYAGGHNDAFVSKIDTTQSGVSSLVYSTYLGGDGYDCSNGIATDLSGNAYVTGYTSSTDFPTQNAFQNDFGGIYYTDAFVTRINTNQSGASSLIYSTFLGGSYIDSAGNIAVDNSNNVYVTGETRSRNFPTRNSFQSRGGVFVSRIDTTRSGASSLIYSTCLGGNIYEYINDMSVNDMAADGEGHVYVTGSTRSTNFPTKNAFQGNGGGFYNDDVFITRIDTTQSGDLSLEYSTYLGGNDYECARKMAVDTCGNVYVTGITNSTDFPTKNSFMSDYGGGDYDTFITRIETTRIGSSSLVYSTYLGGNNRDEVFDVVVDANRNIYMSGFTNSLDFPTRNAFQSDFVGQDDAFVTRIDTSQNGTSSLIFSTYLGGNSWDKGIDVAVDVKRNVYLTGCTGSSDFPTQNPFQNYYSGGVQDVFVTRFSFLAQFKVISPNGGEHWGIGQRNEITWVPDDVTCPLTISLWRDGVLVGTIASEIDPAPGIYNWFSGHLIGGTAAPGTDYKIRIKGKDKKVITDISDAGFTLGKLTVTSPRGGESWQAGTSETITWTAANISNTLKIILMKNGGVLGTIAEGINPAQGYYSWKVGHTNKGVCPVGTDYTIKIKEKGTSIFDFCAAPFSIKGLTITSPNGGEIWNIERFRNITWNILGVSGNVRLSLWKDGVLVGTIVGSVPVLVLSYSWNVGQYMGGTATTGSGYSIKLDLIGSTVADESDSPFTLVPQ